MPLSDADRGLVLAVDSHGLSGSHALEVGLVHALDHLFFGLLVDDDALPEEPLEGEWAVHARRKATDDLRVKMALNDLERERFARPRQAKYEQDALPSVEEFDGEEHSPHESADEAFGLGREALVVEDCVEYRGVSVAGVDA